ncbi:MAG: response regulator transcription factor [Desulfobacter sp.]|nr:MAG: response regulator transcription factor [Desulfobacter sp.]
METIAVVIADDHPLIRQAVKNTFRNNDKIKISGEANNGIELLELMASSVPDIAIIDLEMPKMDGYDTILELHTLYPQTKTVAFSGFLNAANQQRAIDMGAFASISKTESSKQLVEALDAIIRGEAYHSDVTCGFYAGSPAGTPSPAQSVLTLREKQILTLIAEGKTSKQIGEAYNISQWTVNKHRSNIRSKLGHSSLAEMVRYAIEHGYIPPGKN